MHTLVSDFQPPERERQSPQSGGLSQRPWPNSATDNTARARPRPQPPALPMTSWLVGLCVWSSESLGPGMEPERGSPAPSKEGEKTRRPR